MFRKLKILRLYTKKLWIIRVLNKIFLDVCAPYIKFGVTDRLWILIIFVTDLQILIIFVRTKSCFASQFTCWNFQFASEAHSARLWKVRRSIMENESVDGGSRVGLDNESRVSDLHRGGDPSVEASARPSVPCLGSDPLIFL